MTDEADSDELAAFVTSTLHAVAAGISAAQDTLIRSPHGTGVSGFGSPKEIEFDIAVTARTTGAAGGRFKVSVLGIGANANGEIASENSSVSRIKFSVPANFKRTGDQNTTPPSRRVRND
jgi:Trypsin-co-occurring domain 2